MGNNYAYSIFEETVIAVYNLGKLDKPMLAALMEPYRDSDIDRGGERGTLTNDGLDVQDVVIKVWLGESKIPKRPDLPADHKTWTDEQYEKNDAWQERRGELFHQVTDHFGWS